MSRPDSLAGKLQAGLASRRIGTYVADLLKILDGTSGYAALPAALKTSAGVGVIAGTGNTVVEFGDGNIHKTVITLTNTVVTMVDAAGVIAYGGLKIYDMPAGQINFFGAVADLDLTLSAAGINADWDGDIGLGTVTAAGDATLTATEENLIASTATPQASSSATTGDMQSATADANIVIDGTTTAMDVFLNILVDDADHDITTTPTNIIVNGTITMTWMNLGDN